MSRPDSAGKQSLDGSGDERTRLIRAARQRLESLGRAGLDRIPLAGSSAGPRRVERPPVEPTIVVEVRPEPESETRPIAPEPPRPEPVPSGLSKPPSLFDEPGLEGPELAPEDRAE